MWGPGCLLAAAVPSPIPGCLCAPSPPAPVLKLELKPKTDRKTFLPALMAENPTQLPHTFLLHPYRNPHKAVNPYRNPHSLHPHRNPHKAVDATSTQAILLFIFIKLLKFKQSCCAVSPVFPLTCCRVWEGCLII